MSDEKPHQRPAGTQQGAAENFNGVAWVTLLTPPGNPTDCVVGDVTFEPGARNNWHSHAAGQILLVTNGLGYYQEAGQPVRLLRQGDVIKAQPGVKHWHGALPRQAMTHIALNVNTEKGIVTWLQPVTEHEYTSYR
ncbi:cupin domain-containing protein [Hymenobacter sp. BT646]|uniref:Cupin domain-containing protein n=1 Tax=Hymenobacter duratus TaxID=2771356 RepID=A0ABR8JDR1_9BACT|nr:cupin domain-containing protein [Hymenobacter duratus]